MDPHKRIWLQSSDTDEEGIDLDEVTWCEDKINSTDIEYVLADENLTLVHPDSVVITNKRFDELERATPKDHVIAAMVNELTSFVSAYADAQCLREVISGIVIKHLKDSR